MIIKKLDEILKNREFAYIATVNSEDAEMNRQVIGIAIAVMFICSSVFAMCGVCTADGKSADSAKAAVVKVNNPVCPVTGDKVNMKNPATIEYKGETYNLCCPMCAAEFNRDPDKYSAQAKKQLK